MEKLTLTLHKTKDTKNKVVYGTKDGEVIQSVYIDKDALGDVPPDTLEMVISPQQAQGSLLGWGTALRRRAGENEVNQTAGDPGSDTTATGPTGPEWR